MADRIKYFELTELLAESVFFFQILLCLGAHRRIVAPSIFVSRTREVLFDFAMDCDDTGKLILKPRPATA